MSYFSAPSSIPAVQPNPTHPYIPLLIGTQRECGGGDNNSYDNNCLSHRTTQAGSEWPLVKGGTPMD